MAASSNRVTVVKSTVRLLATSTPSPVALAALNRNGGVMKSAQRRNDTRVQRRAGRAECRNY